MTSIRFLYATGLYCFKYVIAQSTVTPNSQTGSLSLIVLIQLPAAPVCSCGLQFTLEASRPLYLLEYHFLLYKVQPWLVWLSGLSADLQTKGSPV